MSQRLKIPGAWSGLGVGPATNRRSGAILPVVAARSGSAVALATADIIAALLSLLVAWRIDASGLVPFDQHPTSFLPGHARTLAAEFAVILAGLIGYFTVQGHYNRRVPLWWKMPDVVAASAMALLCSAFAEFTFGTGTSRVVVFGTWLLFPALLALLRDLTRRGLETTGLWQIRTLVVGAQEAVDRVAEALTAEPELGYRIVGVIHSSQADPSSSVGRQPEDRYWTRLIQQFHAHLVVLAPQPNQLLDRALNEDLVLENVPFAIMPQSEGLPAAGSVEPYFFRHDLTMVSYQGNIARPAARMAKVVLDICGALLMVLFLSPLLLVIALSVKLDGGPVLYAHMRLGASKRRFPCYKFRSMSQNSAAILEHVLSSDPAAAAEWAATQKLRCDPRVTRVGALLRRTSLDELPQLFNVLRLEMSLVGPRPIVENEVRHYGDDIAYYYKARPGVTGLWQVSGRSDTTYGRRVELDTWYVRNWSLWHDLAILGKTVPAVLKRTGAV